MADHPGIVFKDGRGPAVLDAAAEQPGLCAMTGEGVFALAAAQEPGPLIDAIRVWLSAGIPRPAISEDWLQQNH